MGDHADGGGTSFFGQANGLKSDFTQHNEGRFFQDNTIMAATMYPLLLLPIDRQCFF